MQGREGNTFGVGLGLGVQCLESRGLLITYSFLFGSLELGTALCCCLTLGILHSETLEDGMAERERERQRETEGESQTFGR